MTSHPISYTTTLIICDYYGKGWLGSRDRTVGLGLGLLSRLRGLVFREPVFVIVVK